tara:strand:- start:10315 stop:10620 length:306 start_codon:yes stop_codon:yes gene_type:complete
LSGWVKQAEKDSGTCDGVTTEDRDRIKTLEQENRELRQANEIFRKTSAYFVQAELDRPLKLWRVSRSAKTDFVLPYHALLRNALLGSGREIFVSFLHRAFG